MKRSHDMPFGAECRDDGTVRFRLWAPAARNVELCLNRAPDRPLPLLVRDDGWFELVTDAARPGSLYQFRIDDKQDVPDPASRFQPQDVHGPSEVIAPENFNWQDANWMGRPWETAVIYELHVGAFTPRGTFSSALERLDYLRDLGITAIELMPVSDFPGRRNWGYDGVLPFAPDASYGRPEDLKNFIQAAHAREIMVLLDVVYNHFGPEGNYLSLYSPQFFTERHCTPWGNAINFDGKNSRQVRDFFIDNALYWLTEYHFDGLRLDAVHAIIDDSSPDILTELAETVRANVAPNRHVHLILENEKNQARRLRRNAQCAPRTYTAQWNDDIHHTLQVLTTGESDGYYSDYSDHPLDQLGRCLVGGFAYQGDISLYQNGKSRGEPTDGLPLTAFVSFLQNHDQVGNRAFGERITTLADPSAVRAAAAVLILAPSPPLLFMGEEFGTQTPFLFFCDFEKDLAAAVTAGRRNEFARFLRFSDPQSRHGIPDPNAPSTFEMSHLTWNELDKPVHQDFLRFYRELLALRREHIVPHLRSTCRLKAKYEVIGNNAIAADWEFSDGAKLALLANLGATGISSIHSPSLPVLYCTPEIDRDALSHGTMPGWSVVSCLSL